MVPQNFLLKTLITTLFIMSISIAASNDDCQMCHSDPELTTERRGRAVSLYVDSEIFTRSVHQNLECVNCHMDADVEDFPHASELADVECSNCHDDASEKFYAGIHGIALKRGAPYAPTCSECHGVHNILPPTNVNSRTYKMNIPVLCGKCHREGAPVARIYNIPEHDILSNYSQSIHGEGLFKQGLIVTATCNDCHGNHLVLPHTNPKSTISPQNIARTCMNCHARIEEVHLKVIRGELWEKEPGAIPACTDCHPPHKVNKTNLVIRTSDRECLQCHSRSDIHKLVEGQRISLTIDKEHIQNSVHRNIPCVKCHSDVSPQHKRPCDTAGRVDCSKCHVQVAEDYFASDHGQAFFRKDPNAPYCVDCHGSHQTLSHLNERDKTFRANIPDLCGNCHGRLENASRSYTDEHGMVYIDYSSSVHGVGLVEKGLLPSAVCTDCHGSHFILESKNEQSSVNHANLAATCANCHRGIYNDFVKSIHSPSVSKTDEKLPNCEDCHSAHQIKTHQQDQFMTEVTHQCGDCHTELSETYIETMHGKTYTLGYLKAAKCSDCHGAHDIMQVDNPESHVGFNRIVQTCQKCHPDANRRFTGYLTHATHHDRTKYPILHFTFWAMTSLLIGVFSFFGFHTLLWLPRSFQHLKEKRQQKSTLQRYYFKRFSTTQRVLHLFVIFSFVLLALTGMMLKFSSMPWAKFLSDLFGGVEMAGKIHRFAAIITFGYFLAHIITLIRIKVKRKLAWKNLLIGPDSMMFSMKDLNDFYGSLKWFLGLGSRPPYGRWTYWEKFDYFAVFWGVFIIGFSGLILWFPEFFTIFFPGWFINVATIVHSDEALLAVGFIFTIHFFNTHLRPESFPMDKVIFTGLVPLDEYKEDRPEEYRQLKESGQLKKKVVFTEISTRKLLYVKLFGYTFLVIGIALILLIIYSMLFGYK
jgi:predicted CXXCH cytochrome family protein